MILSEWLAEWIHVYKVPTLEKESVKRIERAIKHIPVDLLDTELKDLKALNIDKALATCEYSRTRKYLYYVFCNSLRKAYCVDLIDYDISVKINKVKHKQKKGQALTKTEQAQFLRDSTECRYYLLFKFYLFTGCRRSEGINLKWEDIDYVQRTIHIKGTKTETSDRYFPLGDELLELLREQYNKREDSTYVFKYNKYNVSRRFKYYCGNHKLHDLRHTFITRCAESGVNVSVCQLLVGHADVQTTLNVYMHVMTEFQQSEYKKLKI